MKKIMMLLGKIPAEKWMRMLIIMVVTMLCVAGFHIAGWDGLPCVVFGWMAMFFLYLASQIVEDLFGVETDPTNWPYDAFAAGLAGVLLTVMMY